MVNNKVIEEIYKRYDKRPKSTDCLDFGLLFEHVAEHHDIQVDMDSNELIIRSIDPSSPFHRLPLSGIHAIIPFEEWIAIVMHSSIIFLNRQNTNVSVHLKPHKPNFWERMTNAYA
ncbi:MAG: hypothetical protein K2M79_07550 [Muribaculaceae bacterium]|nr:hypothetical protein [Muribaculaceae bacterium]